jgi:hypothetical protein
LPFRSLLCLHAPVVAPSLDADLRRIVGQLTQPCGQKATETVRLTETHGVRESWGIPRQFRDSPEKVELSRENRVYGGRAETFGYSWRGFFR